MSINNFPQPPTQNAEDYVLYGDGVWRPPGAGGPHAASHQHGGGDEVATATPAAYAIPKANGSNKLANGWLNTGAGNGLDADTVDGQHASAFETAGAVSAHVAAGNPHAQYQRESEKNTAGGYAGLDGSTKLTGSQQVYGTGANTACQGNDSRLSDARTPTGAAGGQLGGTYPSPDVRGLRETGGPTSLTLGAVADGQYLKRSGTSLVGDTPAGGGGGAPTDAEYLVLTLNAGLSADRRLVATGGIIIADGGANGDATLSLTRLSRMYRLRDDFEFNVDRAIDFFVSGTGAANNNATGSQTRIGVVTHTTGTTATGRAGWTTHTALARFGGGAWDAELGIATGATLSNGTDRYTIRAGFLDSQSAEPTDGVFFRYSDNLSAGNWQCVTRNNGVETVTDSGLAVATSTYYRLRIVVNAAGSSVQFYINDVLEATHSTNIPTASGRETAVGAFILKGLGTAARDFQTDYVDAIALFTNPRS